MNVQFYVSITGAKSEKQIDKEVAEIVSYRDKLREAGISLGYAPSAPRVAHSAAPSLGGVKSDDCLELENKWQEMTGKGFRCSPDMAAMFGLPDDRAGRIARMIELVESGQAIRTVSGWQPARGSSKGANPVNTSDEEIDPDEVV